MINAVTFDLWFTLIYSDAELEEYYRETRLSAIAQGFSSFGIKISIDDAKNLLYLAKKEIKRSKKDFYEIHPKKILNIMANNLELSISENELSIIARKFCDAGFDKPPYLNKEARKTLEILREMKLKIGLITNVSRDEEAYNMMLRKLDIIKYFDVISLSSELGFAKPKKEIFEFTLKKLNVLAKEAIHVGDTYEHDIIGAINAGMNSILYKGLFKEYEDARGVKRRNDYDVLTVNDLREIPKLISKL